MDLSVEYKNDSIGNVFLMGETSEKAKLIEPWLVNLHKKLRIPLFKTEGELSKYWNGNMIKLNKVWFNI